MVKLKNIARNDRIISCEAYLEDCEVAVVLSLDEKTEELGDFEFPDGYDYCDSHIAHARDYLSSLVGKEIQRTEKTIMWY